MVFLIEFQNWSNVYSLQSCWLWLPPQWAGEEGRKEIAPKLKCGWLKLSTKVQKVLLDRQFSAHPIILVNCQNSEVVYYNCFASIFIVLEEKKHYWGLHSGIPEASLSQWYFVISNVEISSSEEEKKQNKHRMFKVMLNAL